MGPQQRVLKTYTCCNTLFVGPPWTVTMLSWHHGRKHGPRCTVHGPNCTVRKGVLHESMWAIHNLLPTCRPQPLSKSCVCTVEEVSLETLGRTCNPKPWQHLQAPSWRQALLKGHSDKRKNHCICTSASWNESRWISRAILLPVDLLCCCSTLCWCCVASA